MTNKIRRNRIIGPEDIDNDRTIPQQVRNNPLWPLVSGLLKDVEYMRHEIKVLVKTLHSLSSRFNAKQQYDIEKGVLEDLEYYDSLYNSHYNREMVVSYIVSSLNIGRITMRDAVNEAIKFNSDENALVKIPATSFGLVDWLNENPDNLSDEELESIGNEFGLKMEKGEKETEE